MTDRTDYWFPLPQRPAFPVAVTEDGFPADEVDRIDALWVSHRKQQAEVSGDVSYADELRKSAVIPLLPGNGHDWLFDRISELGRELNFSNYGFEILGICEPLQLAEYGEGDFFQWHMDFGGGEPSRRKLSVTVQLSDPDTYEGGDLQFMSNHNIIDAPRDRGTVIVFPSFGLHRVTPVTRGRRRSIVAWLSGLPYR